MFIAENKKEHVRFFVFYFFCTLVSEGIEQGKGPPRLAFGEMGRKTERFSMV